MIRLSEYAGNKLYRNYNGLPHTIQIRCCINKTFVLISLDKLDNTWRCHFVEHAEKKCEFCGEVQLYTKCWEFTDLVREHYEQILDWLRLQK